MGKPNEILLTRVFWRVVLLEADRKKFVGHTRAVSEAQAVNNVWYRQVKPNYAEADAKRIRLSMFAERKTPRRKPRRIVKEQLTMFT